MQVKGKNMETTKIKNRDTNFELLRIVAMIMILVLHFNGHGKIIDCTDSFEYPLKYLFFNGLEYACIIAVNLYIMITGYYMVKSKIKLHRILELWLEIFFYSVIIYAILVIFNKTDFSMQNLVKSFFPLSTSKYWFMTTYMALYLLIPFINKIINNISKKQYKVLLFIGFVLLSLMPLYSSNKEFESTGGYSLIWFMYLYLISGYIRLYFEKNIKSYKLFIIYICIILVEVILKKMLNKTGVALCGYNFPFTLIKTLCIFLIFKNIKIKNKKINQLILKISPLTLAIYLIHDDPNFSPILWNEILKPSAYIADRKILLIFFTDIIIIFVLSCIIEKIRQFVFEKIRAKIKPNKFSNKLNAKFSEYIN